MFDLIGKYVGSLLFGEPPARSRGEGEAGAASQTKAIQGRKQPVYSVAAPAFCRAFGCGILRRQTGRIVVVTSNFERALTLRDTLNLACGDPPSRRFLDATHQGHARL
jgi:hypothetical protein